MLGNSAAWASDAVIAHRVMQDAIDLPAVVGALADAGPAPAGAMPGGQLDQAARDRLLAVLAKADPSSIGRIRGLRHIMLDDSDINATRHARAVVGGVLAAAVGRIDLFVSGGAEHQGLLHAVRGVRHHRVAASGPLCLRRAAFRRRGLSARA